MEKTFQDQRLARVAEYLQAHCEEKPDLHHIASLAGVSPFYLHRQFSKKFGVSLQALMKQVRLKRAAWQLAYRTHKKIIDVAIEAGFESTESFSRAFRQHCGLTPTAFRQSPDFALWELTELAIRTFCTSAAEASSQTSGGWEEERFAETKVALLTHQGVHPPLSHSISQFIKWRKRESLPPGRSRTFNIFFDDPTTTAETEVRFGIAASGVKSVASNAEGVTLSRIPALTCLVLVVTGEDSMVQQKMTEGIAEHAKQLDFACHPPFLERLTFYPDVPASQATNKLFLPIGR
ncbi:AraC family transcriptional regulator [Alteromonas pelagimontana]|uniref:AraC family transcriptional regulator n=1 Tax=Alteromonas pelagimontana TaxID=1858656 RepID=A0A6M4M8B7_9ALTE|nr:helix-turn-helix domain-containing protein [Alteromonas pelagimontana]QJR79471.1 AraC family transcriptional regulator [Alteromonas pelagimontana]